MDGFGSLLAQETREKLALFNDPKFVFEPVEHVYTYGERKIIGATTYLKQFSEEFDEMYWSEKNASKEGCTPAELRARWDATRDRACYLGSLVHEGIEGYWAGEDHPVVEDAEAQVRLDAFVAFANKHMSMLEIVAIEQRMFSVEWGIAGTLDALFIHDGNLIVGDWKTNGKFRTNDDYAFKKLHKPFGHLKENEFNKYCIQMAIYRLMLEQVGIETTGAFLCHIPKDGNVRIHKTTDLTGIMRRYLNGHRDSMHDAPLSLF